jgi:hypothetical protein
VPAWERVDECLRGSVAECRVCFELDLCAGHSRGRSQRTHTICEPEGLKSLNARVDKLAGVQLSITQDSTSRTDSKTEI